MQCVTPMFRRYEVGNYKKGKIVPRSEVMEQLSKDPNVISFCLDKMNNKVGAKYKYETVPCGKCWACRLNYSAEWATRLTYECQETEHNYFVTLTYNDDNLPIATAITVGDKTWYNEGDEIWQEGTVCEEHMIKFLHDLRQYFRRSRNHTGIKYFYCMEYGETTHRPHAHIILMNCPLDIMQFYDTHIDENYKEHWKSKEVEKFWPHGMIDIASAEWSSCAYVARYCLKKLHDKNNEEYAKEGKMPEFVRMSKGIGKKYYEQNKKTIYEHDEIIMRTVKGNVGAFKPPKSWDKLFKEEFPDEWKKIHSRRQICANEGRKLETTLSDYSDMDRLLIKSKNLEKKVKNLPRVGEF